MATTTTETADEVEEYFQQQEARVIALKFLELRLTVNCIIEPTMATSDVVASVTATGDMTTGRSRPVVL